MGRLGGGTLTSVLILLINLQNKEQRVFSAGLAAAEGGESSAAGLITGKQSVIMENPGIPRFFLGPTRLSFLM